MMARRPSKTQQATYDCERTESYLNDPAYAAHSFGVEFDGSGTLEERGREVAYFLGYEEGRTGRPMDWSERLLAWAKMRCMPSVKRSFEAGKQDGAGTRR